MVSETGHPTEPRRESEARADSDPHDGSTTSPPGPEDGVVAEATSGYGRYGTALGVAAVLATTLVVIEQVAILLGIAAIALSAFGLARRPLRHRDVVSSIVGIVLGVAAIAIAVAVIVAIL